MNNDTIIYLNQPEEPCSGKKKIKQLEKGDRTSA
jgi:hypothetical protein